MRIPIFLGLRPDKDPKEVKRELPMEAAEGKNEIKKSKKASPGKDKKTAVKKKQNAQAAEDDLVFTNLDKVFWPKDGYTKGDLIEYYRIISPYILPYLKDRPQTLHRFPNGIEYEGFYQKNINDTFPSWVPTFVVKHKDDSHRYLMIPDLKTLLYSVNLGCIDFNPFSSRVQKLEYPDYMILDLDPENVPFTAVIETALVIHELLSSHAIPSYCKTSGATGLHIYVPVGGLYTYEQTKQFAHLLAVMTNQLLPAKTSVLRSPSKRQKRVYVDYLQNNFGQTLAAPYCVRPRPGATVSTPLDWSEVKPGLDPHSFTIKTIPERLKKKGDLFAPVLEKGINLPKILKKLGSDISIL